MRLFGSLIAANVWLLVGGCGDARPARVPAELRQPRPALAAEVAVSGSGSGSGHDPALPPAGPNPAKSNAVSEDPEGTRLAERFLHARPLSILHGSASYYSDALAGRKTASGAVYAPERFTAAHRTLPFGTVLRITRIDGGRVVYVRVNDRGPFGPRGRIVDLSRAAAEELGMLRAGVVKVRVEVLEHGAMRHKRRRRR